MVTSQAYMCVTHDDDAVSTYSRPLCHYVLFMFIKHLKVTYYLIYLTLHWPFLFNLRPCSLSINSYEYSCHGIWAGLFNALFHRLMYGKVAQWLKFLLLIMISWVRIQLKACIFFSRTFYLIIFVVDFFHFFHVLYLLIITTMHVQLKSYIKI